MGKPPNGGLYMALHTKMETGFSLRLELRSIEMAEQLRKSWLRSRVEDGLRRGFQHAYEKVKVDPNKFLLQLRAAYGVPINSFQGIYSVDVAVLDDLSLIHI